MKTELTVAGVIILIFAILIGPMCYGAHLAHLQSECVESAMQNAYDAVSIQAICRF
jgi:hypothetical protein